MRTDNIRMMLDALVKVTDTYEREIDVGGIKATADNKVDNVRNTIRFGKIVSLPIAFNVNLEIGDTIYFHHNITREPERIAKGEKIHNGRFDFRRSDGLFVCPLKFIYAVERNGVIHALDPYCYILPEYDSNGEYIEGYGYIKYINDTLKEKGFKVGDKIIYSKDSDYSFWIKGERLFRMETEDILGKIKGSN